MAENVSSEEPAIKAEVDGDGGTPEPMTHDEHQDADVTKDEDITVTEQSPLSQVNDDNGEENSPISQNLEPQTEEKAILRDGVASSQDAPSVSQLEEYSSNSNACNKSRDQHDESRNSKEHKEEKNPDKNVNQGENEAQPDAVPERSEPPSKENIKETPAEKTEKQNAGLSSEVNPGPGHTENEKLNAASSSQQATSSLTPRKALIGAIPSNDISYIPRDSVAGSRTRLPPKFMRMSTVSMINGSPRPITRESSIYTESPRLPRKGVGWSEATNSRPPLRIDLEGPTPCTYSPRNKPLGETNAPAYSFGIKCQPEKGGGGRTSWWKAWFQTPHVWLNKVDFLRDRTWPTPSLYENQFPIGTRQASMPTAPAFSISTKKSSIVKFPGVVESPSPNHYNRESADGQTLRRSSSFTHGRRRGGTIPWPAAERTPGPGQYDATSICYPSNPAFTIQGLRREKSYVLGPFSTF